jgi:hypothetical protein
MATLTRPDPNLALQLEITLRNTRPRIWRRVLVLDNLTFWDLHVVIQCAMGWSDRHMHRFEVRNPWRELPDLIGLPEDERANPVRAGWDVLVRKKLTRTRPRLTYIYDFCSGWNHRVVLEKTLPIDDGEYPRCIGGRMRCPPEGCGGTDEYEDLLATLADPDHRDREEALAWLGGPIDPRAFDPDEVVFRDPDSILRRAFLSLPPIERERFLATREAKGLLGLLAGLTGDTLTNGDAVTLLQQ